MHIGSLVFTNEVFIFWVRKFTYSSAVKKGIDTNDRVASLIFRKSKLSLFLGHILQVLVACRNMAAMFLANVTDNYIDKLCRCIDLVFGFNPSSTPTPLPSQRYECTSPNMIAVCLVGEG